MYENGKLKDRYYYIKTKYGKAEVDLYSFGTFNCFADRVVEVLSLCSYEHLEVLEQRLKITIEALKFYSKERNYDYNCCYDEQGYRVKEPPKIFKDNGKKAKKILSEIYAKGGSNEED